MKTKITLIAAILGFALLPLPQASGQDSMGEKVETLGQDQLTLPIPVHIVEPIIAWEHVGERVEMMFTIRKNGRPSAIRSREASPKAWQLAETLKQVIAKWRFAPARDHLGQPVEVTAILPVRVVAYDTNPTMVAQLEIPKP